MKRSKTIAAASLSALALGVGGWVASGAGSASAAGASAPHGWPMSGPASGAAAAVTAAQATAAQIQGQVIVVRAHALSFVDVDVNQDGFGPGDYFLFREELKAPHSQQVVGRDAVRCTAGFRTFTCDGTIQLAGRGKLTVYGTEFSERDSRLAVTGGTSKFIGVNGQLDTNDLPGGSTQLVFTLRR